MKKKHRKIFYPTIFILGLFSMVWQISIYQNTIIDLPILFGIILIVGIITFLVGYKKYGKTYKYSGIGLYFYSFLHYLCGYGFLACSVFTLTNYYLADKTPIKKTFEIVERTWLLGSKYHRDEKQPAFKINYDKKLKQLVFPHKYYKNMALYKNVELEVREGFFGFDILVNKKLTY